MSDYSVNPQLMYLLRETGTSVTEKDLEALSKVSVRELAKLFDSIASGISKRDALNTLRQDALLKLEKQRRELEQKEENVKKMQEKVEEEKRRKERELREKEETMKRTHADFEKQKLEELERLKAEQDEKLRQQEEQKRLELEQMETQKREEMDRKERELREREEKLKQFEAMLKAEEERKKREDEERRKEDEIRRAEDEERKRKEGEEKRALEEKLKQQEEDRKRLEEEMKRKLEEEVKLKEEQVKQLEEEAAAAKKIAAEAEEQQKLIAEKLKREEAERLQKAEEDKRREEAEKSRRDEEEKTIREEEEKARLQEEEKLRSMEDAKSSLQQDDDPSSPAPSTTSGADEDDDDSDAEEGSEKLPNGIDQQDIQRAAIEGMADENAGARPIPDYQVDINTLETRKWLKPRFDVIKFDPKNRLFSKKIRTWELDFFGSRFNNLSRKGKLKKSHTPDKLFQIEKHAVDLKRLKLQFFEAGHPYELLFDSAESKDRFFECCSAIRPNLFCWCPDLCKPNETKSRTTLYGTYGEIVKGIRKSITGHTKINVSSKPMETIQVFCATWNMGGISAPKDPKELQAWIPAGQYDIYAIGLQESSFSKNNDLFVEYMQTILGKEYVTLASMLLWDIQLIVLAKKKHFLKITSVQGATKPTGFMNICGNKGGVGISIRFNETNILFVNCHLAANRNNKSDANVDNTNLRNQNVQEIMDNLKFRNKELDLQNQFHHIFFMGDTNYRVEKTYEEAVKLVQAKNFSELCKVDQFRLQQNAGNVLSDFNEADINFAPTFKYTPGTLQFDDKKARTPSYTDRVFWKSLPGCSVACTKYESCEAIQISDHLPVSAAFKVNTNRPYVSIFCKSEPKCSITIDNLTIIGRNANQLIQKPTIYFYGDFLGATECTQKGNKASNPKWTGKQIPALKPTTWNREYLKIQHVIIALRDGSPKPESTENLLGSACLPLKQAVAEAGNIVEFALPMYLHGVHGCTVTGQICVKYEKQ